MPTNPITELKGNVVEETTVKIEGTKLVGKDGPVLVTHWGMSGLRNLAVICLGCKNFRGEELPISFRSQLAQ